MYSYLEDHPGLSKWFITMVIGSPLNGSIPPSKWSFYGLQIGLTNQLTSPGRILQVPSQGTESLLVALAGWPSKRSPMALRRGGAGVFGAGLAESAVGGGHSRTN